MKFEQLNKKLHQGMDSEHDMRENARECAHFVEKRDGQWEPDVLKNMKGKPRYTDDRVTPIINQIAGEMSNADFTLQVSPAGGESSEDTAKIYNGLIRTIRVQSDAEAIFKAATKQFLKTGISGWEIVQDYADSDTFDQDLLIKPIFNYESRVWIDPYSLEQNNSDAKWGVVLDYVSKDEYEKQFPDGSMMSVGHDNNDETYSHKPEYITIGRAYYKKPVKRELVEMSNGAVYEVNDEFNAIADDLAAAGITEKRRRVRDSYKVYQRIFGGDGWLNDEEETVFDHIPIITVYANYSVSEGKRLFHGAVEKLIDLQRVHNYAFSREIEEVALAPRAKFFMTAKQVEGYEASIATLNTNMDPVQLYNVDEQAPPPQQIGGAQINPALRTVVSETGLSINQTAGMFGASLGDNPNLQSGIAIEKQVDQGNNGIQTYYDSMEVAIRWTGKVLLNAIPRVYDSTRQVMLTQEDGSDETIVLNQPIIDAQTGSVVELNDLSKGNYDVICEIGPAFKNKQEKAAETMIRAAQVDPAVMELGRDVLYRNINAEGMKDLSQRARSQMLNQGLIPFDQMTEEERQYIEQQQQSNEQQPDPNMLLAEAEMTKAQADMLGQQNKQQEIQLKAADIQAKYQAQNDKLASETQLNIAKVEQGQQKLIIDQAQNEQATQMQMMQMMLDQQKAQADSINKLASALNNLKSSMGADAIMSAEAAQAYNGVAQQINEEL